MTYMRMFHMWKNATLTAHAFEAFQRQSPRSANAIRTQLMKHASNSERVSKHSRNLSHAPIAVDGIKLARIEICVPVGHVDNVVIILRSRVRELWEEASRVQIVIVFVNLLQCITHFEMRLKIIHPMVLGAVDRDPTVRTFEMNMRRWESCRRFCGPLGFPRLGIMDWTSNPSSLVARMGAKSILSHECRSSSYVWRRWFGEGME